MTDILGAGCRTEVRLSIIEAVMIDMVNDKTFWNFYYLSVHANNGFFVLFMSDFTPRIKSVAAFADVPFELSQPLVILRVNNGEFTLGQGYSPEGVPISNAAIEKYRQDTYSLNPGRYVKANFDGTPPSIW